MELKTQPNEKRCMKMSVTHVIDLPACCPVSGNPLEGSQISISYKPKDFIIEVYSLKSYINSYKGGKGAIRSMEGMIQQITKDCSDAAKVSVVVESDLIIHPGQKLKLTTVQHV